jgi:hypothetical protein
MSSAQVVEAQTVPETSRYRCSEIEYRETLLQCLESNMASYQAYKKCPKADQENEQKIMRSIMIQQHIYELQLKIHDYEITKDDETYKLLKKYRENDIERKPTTMILKKLRKIYDDI